ncbi:hypothetical protein D8674_042498 [Pyrus ussuriensis x Pyrus communis]|uniref:Uncharacterized protein n=1 Tax=Pyrus ussuriensis x Pyrus communis TaxID=2448454 RepID=A0A5N5H6J7_9ROSA|nr:hypothetical protein D8674_042498 [Pyrus ussuriensis x Pyrus communis]
MAESKQEEQAPSYKKQLMVSSAAALGGAAAAVDMDAGLAEDADADLGGRVIVVVVNRQEDHNSQQPLDYKGPICFTNIAMI